MSMMDKVVAAVTPEASEQDRIEARQSARQMAGHSGWLSMVLDHHEQIEQAFAAVRGATSDDERLAAQKTLNTLLTGHSVAEEAVLYPAMALTDQKGHSGTAYTEQSAAKVQAAALETMDPRSEDYLDKLEHLRAAVAHHVYEEESKWYPELVQETSPVEQQRLTLRYREEFECYMGKDSKTALAGQAVVPTL